VLCLTLSDLFWGPEAEHLWWYSCPVGATCPKWLHWEGAKRHLELQNHFTLPPPPRKASNFCPARFAVQRSNWTPTPPLLLPGRGIGIKARICFIWPITGLTPAIPISCLFDTPQEALTCPAGSALDYTGGFLSSNRVQYTLTERNKYGLVGAIYVRNNTYALRGLELTNNSAFLGGGLFASSDFSSGSTLSGLTYGANSGLLGRGILPPPPRTVHTPAPASSILHLILTQLPISTLRQSRHCCLPCAGVTVLDTWCHLCN